MPKVVAHKLTDKFPLMELVGYEWHEPEVERFHRSKARLRIPSAPARTSKSYSAAFDVLQRFFPKWAVMDDGSVKPMNSTLGWIVATDYRTAKEWDYLWSVLVEDRQRYGFAFEIERAVNNPGQGTMIIVVRWGRDPDGKVCKSILECKSATNERSLQGEEVDYCIMSEAAEHDERIYARYLATRCGEIICPTTPKIKAEWLQKLIEAGERDPGLGIESFHFTPRANPTYNWGRFWFEHRQAEARVGEKVFTEDGAHDCFDPGTLCKARKDAAFAEQFLGEWTYEAERVLPFRWQESTYGPSHVIHDIPDWIHTDARYAVSTDWGYRDAASAGFWAIGPDGTVIRCAEVYQSKLPPEEFVRMIQAKVAALGWNISYYVGDPKKPEVAAIMRQSGLPVFIANKQKMADRAAGLLTFIQYLSVDPNIGRPLLYVVSEQCGAPYGCPKTIREWKLLRNKPIIGNEFGTGAFHGDDHSFDDTRYFLMTSPSGREKQRTWDEIEDHRRWVLRVQGRAPSQAQGGLAGYTPMRATL